MDIGFSTNYNNINLYENYPVLQITLGNPSEANYEETYDYDLYKNKKTKIFLHSKFTYNISKNNINYSIKKEITFLKNIKQKNTGVIIHLSKNHKNTKEEGLKDVANKLNELCEKYIKDTSFYILLETSYNINHLGSSIDDFYYIFENLNDLSKTHIGICIDTSHIFLSGYPINNVNYLIEYFALFDEKIGLEKIKLIHLNDINSKPFGKHTPHLSILNNTGKIFYNNYINLDFILSLSKLYKIPLILERNFSKNVKQDILKINEEIHFINSYKIVSLRYFNIIIKNIIFLNFVNLLIDFYEINFHNENVENLKKLKKFIIESYNEKNKNYFNSTKLKFNQNQYIYDIINKREYKEFYDDFNNILNNYNYNLFLKYLNSHKYISIKNLLTLKFIGIESALKLYNNYNIFSIEDLLNLPLKTRKQILTNVQYKSLQNYKFLKNNIYYDIALQIEEKLKSNLYPKFNINIYGSFYRSKNNIDNLKIFKDLDALLVVNNEGETELFLKELYKIFLLKGIILDGDKKKFIVLKYEIKKKNYFFILDLYICKPEEELYMFIYLKNSKFKNILLRKIAKAKKYILSNTSLYDIVNTKYIFLKEEKELYNLLGIDFL